MKKLILILVILGVAGLVWEFRGITFWTATVQSEK